MHSIQTRSFASLSRRVFLAIATALAIGAPSAHAGNAIKVTASLSILGDLVRAVGGERVRVSTLVGPDQDARTFEPKPSDAKMLVATQLLVTNGLNFEPWATKLAQSARYKGPVLVASQGVKARPNDSIHGKTQSTSCCMCAILQQA